MNKGGRAVLSSIFAFIVAVTLIVFVLGVSKTTSFQHWSLTLIVVWAILLALGMVLWASRDWTGVHLVGNPTLGMIAGVSGGIIAAVALAFSLNSTLAQEQTLEEQTKVMESQLQAMRNMEAELARIREALNSPVRAGAGATPAVEGRPSSVPKP
jgi:cell shape-determining protein MreC